MNKISIPIQNHRFFLLKTSQYTHPVKGYNFYFRSTDGNCILPWTYIEVIFCSAYTRATSLRKTGLCLVSANAPIRWLHREYIYKLYSCLYVPMKCCYSSRWSLFLIFSYQRLADIKDNSSLWIPTRNYTLSNHLVIRIVIIY